jgi:hypothetical protein
MEASMEDVISRAPREHLHDTKRQCTATSKTSGERCRRPPIPGGFVCAFHGGKSPLAVQAARERLLAMVDPAIDALMRILKQSPPCDVCGRADADRDPVVLRAAQVVLDRAGHHPTLSVQHTTGIPPYFAWLLPAQRDQMSLWLTEARAAMERGEPRPAARLALPVAMAVAAEAEDAELVEDDDSPSGGV